MKDLRSADNIEIAELLRAVAASYQLQDSDTNKFRIIAYERAADAVEHLSSEIKDIWDEGKLDDIPGVGPSIAKHLDEIFKKGYSSHFKALMKNIPPAVFTLMELPQIGVKTAFKLVKALKLETSTRPVADLEAAAKKGLIAPIEGFGEESQADIIRGIEASQRMVKRHLLPYAIQIADGVMAWMKQDSAVKRIEALGSIRRRVSTVGDIDLAVASSEPEKVISRFTRYSKVTRVIEKGDKTASILLPGNIQVDLMVQSPIGFGSLLQHQTGSKHHNIALREYALRNGYSLSEYGIRQASKPKSKIQTFTTEEDFYKYLGLDWIPPELREDTGEIESAKDKSLPQLVEFADIKGDFHLHSDFDIQTSHDMGEGSMEDLVDKAISLGYQYLAFSEHNPSKSRHSEKEILEILKRKQEMVEKLNYSFKKRVIKIFNSLEVDILPDGNLAIPEKGLDYLDFALISIHSAFNQNQGMMTKRLLKALTFSKVKILSHPTGRKLNEREGVEADWKEIYTYCAKHNIYLEVNADPMRLDLPDFMIRDAISAGVKLVIGTDAHSLEGMDTMLYGVYTARRGWAQRGDIINTCSDKEIEKKLNKGR